MQNPASAVGQSLVRDFSKDAPMVSGEAAIEVVSYDPAWPARFDEERQDIRRVLGSWLAGPIEHIGSTAIPGIAAKPVIDIMAGVESLGASAAAIPAAATLGYCYFPYQPDLKHWFCKPSPNLRTHHLHLVPIGTPQWVRALAFRDYLRVDAKAAAEYETLKRRLAQTFKFDREAYTEAKSPFINAVTEKALASGYGGKR